MHNMIPAPGRLRPDPRFRRDRLTRPGAYFQAPGFKLIGGFEWKKAICPFHGGSQSGLRVHLDTGNFRGRACSAPSGNTLLVARPVRSSYVECLHVGHILGRANHGARSEH